MEASVVTTSSGNTGPLGQQGIGTGSSTIVTLGYSWYWVYKTEEDGQAHREGLGGGRSWRVIWILIQPVMAFVIPSEIGKMYRKDGRAAAQRLDRPVALPGRNPHHSRHRLVREGAGRSERLLGVRRGATAP